MRLSVATLLAIVCVVAVLCAEPALASRHQHRHRRHKLAKVQLAATTTEQTNTEMVEPRFVDAQLADGYNQTVVTEADIVRVQRLPPSAALITPSHVVSPVIVDAVPELPKPRASWANPAAQRQAEESEMDENSDGTPVGSLDLTNSYVSSLQARLAALEAKLDSRLRAKRDSGAGVESRVVDSALAQRVNEVREEVLQRIRRAADVPNTLEAQLAAIARKYRELNDTGSGSAADRQLADSTRLIRVGLGLDEVSDKVLSKEKRAHQANLVALQGRLQRISAALDQLGRSDSRATAALLLPTKDELAREVRELERIRRAKEVQNQLLQQQQQQQSQQQQQQQQKPAGPASLRSAVQGSNQQIQQSLSGLSDAAIAALRRQTEDKLQQVSQRIQRQEISNEASVQQSRKLDTSVSRLETRLDSLQQLLEQVVAAVGNSTLIARSQAQLRDFATDLAAEAEQVALRNAKNPQAPASNNNNNNNIATADPIESIDKAVDKVKTFFKRVMKADQNKALKRAKKL